MGFLFAIAILIGATLWEAFVVVSLWGWFAAPVFGLPALTYPVAIGLTCLVGLMTRQHSPSGDDDLPERIAQALVAPGAALLVGWIAKQYI